jgi:hypothetical protein
LARAVLVALVHLDQQTDQILFLVETRLLVAAQVLVEALLELITRQIVVVLAVVAVTTDLFRLLLQVHLDKVILGVMQLQYLGLTVVMVVAAVLVALAVLLRELLGVMAAQVHQTLLQVQQ